MSDIGKVALKCPNSKCICQTLNKFGVYIALNQISDLLEFIWSLFAVLSGVLYLDDCYRTNCNEMFKFECICQTLNKFGVNIALNQISDWSEFIWNLVAMLFASSKWKWLI